MISAKYAPYVVGLMMSGVMTFFVSGFATYRGLGLIEGFSQIWMEAWWPCWLLAFPIIMTIGPLARKLVARFTVRGDKPPTSAPQGSTAQR